MSTYFGLISKATSLIGPTQKPRLFGRIGAKIPKVRYNAYTPQIEPIGIPTSLNGDIAGGQAVGVVGAGCFEQGEMMDREMECFAVQYFTELCSTPAVAGVMAFIGASRIMKNGEERHHQRLGTGERSQTQAILKDASPVGYAVDTFPG